MALQDSTNAPRTPAPRAACWAGAVALLSGAPGWAEAPMTADRVLECAGANAPDRTFVQPITFDVTTAGGDRREIKAKVFGERTERELKLNFQLLAPSDVAGTAVLIREKVGQDDMYIYLPGLRRTRRVTGRMAATKLFGTDFSYLDIKQVFGAFLDGPREYLGMAESAGRRAHRVKVTPGPEEQAPFQSMVAAIDADTCVPLAVEFMDAQGASFKRLHADVARVVKVGERHLAQVYTLKDIANGSQTVAALGEPRFDVSIGKVTFDPATFQDVR